MRARFLNAARAELKDATTYYENQRKGLGKEFSAEMRGLLAHIKQFPLSGSALTHGLRRRHGSQFPYGIVYHVGKSLITVVAVMHLRRKPGYYLGRMDLE